VRLKARNVHGWSTEERAHPGARIHRPWFQRRRETLGDVGPFGEAIHVERARKNILSLGQLLQDGHKVRLAGNKGFDIAEACVASGLETEEQRGLQLTKVKLAGAKEARRAEEVLGFVSPTALTYAISKGAINEATFTAKDVAIA
jgi:hypothetical protein